MKILVTGGRGQLAHALALIADLSGAQVKVSPFYAQSTGSINIGAERELLRFLPEAASCLSELDEIYLLAHQELDICDPVSIDAAFKHIKPDVLINCAAYNAVDKAEVDVDNAYQINAQGPKLLAEQCKRDEVKLIHISTDFVFSGDKGSAYDEQARPSPISVYGKSKLAGDNAVLQILGNQAYIVRTAWLYSAWQQNFVKTMQQLFRSSDKISVIDTQRGSPTWCEPLAVVIFKLVKMAVNERKQDNKHSLSDDALSCGDNVYHYAGHGHCSWFDFSRHIQDLMGKADSKSHCTVTPISTECWQKLHPNPLAARPTNSGLCSDKILAEISMEHDSLIRASWQQQLQVMLAIQALSGK
ncbi:dTDP-4-dehydrorhamnose reductase [Shewanella sp. GutDb-MelDb]|uniref:dTDP-4-dehydrorhamnose reductase n=1 Tax=Shewanella sp. GutDb-MelDb TaxID=2058316 RepID=UPI000C7A7855|nr:dTDP-4-dehydrorhamnose reductase [Shewanella sp. GutDb-MelDb]PKG56604.1 dTDP-4-dehydrorhamnose reductase [Shewanella sp. GutDb-MelDb]